MCDDDASIFALATFLFTYIIMSNELPQIVLSISAEHIESFATCTCIKFLALMKRNGSRPRSGYAYTAM